LGGSATGVLITDGSHGRSGDSALTFQNWNGCFKEQRGAVERALGSNREGRTKFEAVLLCAVPF